MTSVFDIASVVLFLVVAVAFLFLTDREPGTISRLLVPCVAAAIANQVGNAGHDLLAWALLGAASVYAVIVVRSHPA